MNNDNKTLEEIDRLELLAASYACDYRDSPNKTNGIPDSYLVYSIAYDAFLDGYKAAQDQLADADKVMPQWISVSDRLPEIDKYVLITRRTSPDYTNLKVMEACRISDDQYEIWGDHAILADYVDYWMPLPAPPKEEK